MTNSNIFSLMKKECNLVQIYLKFVSEGLIDNSIFNWKSEPKYFYCIPLDRVIICSGNDLILNKQQAITWTNNNHIILCQMGITRPHWVIHNIISVPCVVLITHPNNIHDDVIKWKHFLHYWLFVRGIHHLPPRFRWYAKFMLEVMDCFRNYFLCRLLKMVYRWSKGQVVRYYRDGKITIFPSSIYFVYFHKCAL